MNLILHHLRKDIRAQRWLLLLWAFFILVYLGANLLTIQPDYNIAHVGETLVESPLLGVGSSLVWTILIVGLIQSEPVVGTNSFWLTRPVPRWVLIPSKLIFLLVFLIVPWLAITPCGMLLLHVDPELYREALLPAWWTFGLTIVVLWIATFTRTLGGFFAVTGLLVPAVVVLVGVRLYFRNSQMSAASYQLGATQLLLAIFFLVSGLAVSALVQQLFRKTPTGIWIAMASAVVALLAGFFWPVALPDRLTMLSFIAAGATDSPAQKNVQVDFAPDWPASLMWSQPNQPNGASTTVKVGNGVIAGVSTTKPISTKDDEGNPIIIGALVASAQLTPVTSSPSEFPIIEGVEASFKLPDRHVRTLPRRDTDVYGDKSALFDLVKAVQSDLPGIAITTSTHVGSTLAPTTLFKLDAENLDRFRGKTGDLQLHLYGHMQTLARQAAIPLDGDASSRIPNGVIHVFFTTHQTQSIFGMDFPTVTQDKPMLAVWKVDYQPTLSRFRTDNYYILVDTTTHTGVTLSSATTYPQHAAGTFSLRSSWNEYLTLPFDPSSHDALAHKVLYVYSSTPQAFFNATLTAPGFTMSPP